MPHDHLMRAALYLAARGMRVFPLKPGTKVPAVRRDWEGCATTDVDQIERWWARSPHNIGIAAGPSRLLVVDLDAPKISSAQRIPHGRQVLAALAREAGEAIPRNTLTVATARGGQHLYFRAPHELSLTNTAGRLGRHIDTRANGGYVVGPGSIVDGRRYRMVRIAEPVPVPAWIVRALRPTMPHPPAPMPKAHPAYVRAALDGEARRVADAPVGRRNVTLYQAAASLGRFIREGQLRDDDVRSVLGAAAAHHVGMEGFGAHEVDRTIDSGLRRSVTTAPRSSGRSVRPPGRDCS